MGNKLNSSAELPAAVPVAPARSPLGQLLMHIAQQAPHKYSIQDAAPSTPINTWPSEPPETDYFQKTWARLGTNVQLKQSQGQVPDNAGPLNSNQLIHRALMLMQEQSAGYLQRFLSYVDTLSWIEQLHTAATPPAKAATRVVRATSTTSTKKAPRKAR